MAATHHTRAKGMQKVRLETLWQNCHQVKSPKRSRVDKAIFSHNTYRSRPRQDTNEIRLLEIEKAKLTLELKEMTRRYKGSRKTDISCKMADLIVTIEKISDKIARLR